MTGRSFSKILLTPLFAVAFYVTSYSQEVRIQCTETPLNQILITMRTDYGVMLSFDDKRLSSFILTVNNTFPNVENALDFLLAGLPLKYENNNGVYVIFSFRVKEKPRKFIISGKITDRTSSETLPYSGILINNSILSSDAQGNFSFVSLTDSVYHIRVSYIGYYVLDTIVNTGSGYNFRLLPSVIAMKEVVVKGSVVARTIQAGSSPGIIRINHKIAYYLPGNGDNSIFNLLRLQPGILASGEQSADLIIWGSYEGQSQVIFDGFTVYGMKNFNDNISAINPYMAKDIKVLKGGFGAEYGERVGGIVDITGADGNRLSPSAQLCVNNMTLNGIASVPFKKKSALQLAYRQTYYDLYNPVIFSTSGYGRGRQSSQADYYLSPDYNFRDMNLKFSGENKSSNYYISLYGGSDNFAYKFDQETAQKTITLEHNEKNYQLGGALLYELNWKDKNTTSFIASYSSLRSYRLHDENITRVSGPQTTTALYDNYYSSINEINARTEDVFNVSQKHKLETGLGIVFYFTDWRQTLPDDSYSEGNSNLTVPYLYFQDNINLSTRFTIRPGFRADFHSLTGKLYFQPRLSVLYRINDFLRLNSAVGSYNQFVAKNMFIESSGNYRLSWSICDNNEVAVLNSQSLTAGFTYSRNGFTISTEGYLKRTGGVTRFIETTTGSEIYTGDSRTKGIDVFVKQDFKAQTFWVSYSLSKTVEHFPYFITDAYIPAMQDQRHEIKLAAITKFRSFHFSVNYVFGSGFPDPDQLPEVVEYLQPYSRLDAAIVCKISNRRVHVDAGVSVLNVLNKENIRYSNYTRIPTDETTTISLYAEAVPLTPTIFLNIYF